MMQIKNEPLREEIRKFVLNKIIIGSFKPSKRIGISDLASSLGVSETPTREALTQLQKEGMVTFKPNQGFFAPPLTKIEARELYPIVWNLECLAIQSQGKISEKQFLKLNRINQKLAKEKTDPNKSLELDRNWHRVMIQNCSNETLISIIEQLKNKIQRYEIAFMKESGRIPFSIEEHTKIASLLYAGDLDQSKDSIKKQWKSSLKFQVDWLKD